MEPKPNRIFCSPNWNLQKCFCLRVNLQLFWWVDGNLPYPHNTNWSLSLNVHVWMTIKYKYPFPCLFLYKYTNIYFHILFSYSHSLIKIYNIFFHFQPKSRPRTSSAKSKVSRASESDISVSRSISSMTQNPLPRPKKYEPLPKPQPPPIRSSHRKLSRSLDLNEKVSKSTKSLQRTLSFTKDRPKDSSAKTEIRNVDMKMPYISGYPDGYVRNVKGISHPKSGASWSSHQDNIEKENADYNVAEAERRLAEEVLAAPVRR